MTQHVEAVREALEALDKCVMALYRASDVLADYGRAAVTANAATLATWQVERTQRNIQQLLNAAFKSEQLHTYWCDPANVNVDVSPTPPAPY